MNPTDKRTLQLEVRTVYGRELIYPVCLQSQLLLALVNSKTFSPKHVRALINAGYTIEWDIPDHKIKVAI